MSTLCLWDFGQSLNPGFASSFRRGFITFWSGSAVRHPTSVQADLLTSDQHAKYSSRAQTAVGHLYPARHSGTRVSDYLSFPSPAPCSVLHNSVGLSARLCR